MGEHHRLIPDRRSRTTRYQTVRSRFRESRSRTVRRRAARARYQLPDNVSGRSHGSAPTGAAQAWHRLAPAVVRPRLPGRLPTVLEALIPWAPALIGVGILIGFIISVVVLPVSSSPRPDLPDFPGPAAPDVDQPPPDEGASDGFRNVVPGAQEVQHSPVPESPPAPPTPPEPGPALTGKYKLDEVYSDVFIGVVLIFNESNQAAAWTVELAYGRDVGDLNTFWVDGTPQPGVERVDDRHVFTSAVDLPAQSAVALKVHYDRFGDDIDPKVCLVNDTECRR